MPDGGEPVVYMGWQEETFAEIRGRLEAENVRLRAALEQIGKLGCEDVHRGIVDEECPISYTETDTGWCPPCTAAAALEEK